MDRHINADDRPTHTTAIAVGNYITSFSVYTQAYAAYVKVVCGQNTDQVNSQHTYEQCLNG